MKYIANPVEVQAYKIVSAGQPQANGSVCVALDNGYSLMATPAMCSRYIPKAGDYWVIQSDGYAYLNPKDVFERKYRPAEDCLGSTAQEVIEQPR
jgi:hypothetical protein